MEKVNEAKIIKVIGDYKIVEWFANAIQDEDNTRSCYGDIYETKAQAEEEHPGDEILTGYGIIDKTGYSPDSTLDWYDTPKEAEVYIKKNLEN